MNNSEPRTALDRFGRKVLHAIDIPCTWFRETIVLPNRKSYPYYHRKFNRVPTIDQCDEEDPVCMYEANEQFKRDRNVEGQIMTILRYRFEDCYRYERFEFEERCKKVKDDYYEAELNFFIKYGDLGSYAHAKHCYMKQKHRMIYERRKAAGTWRPDIMPRPSMTGEILI